MEKSIVDWIHQREVEPECSIGLQRAQIVTREQLDTMRHTFTLHGHDGCVNTICWNHSGSLLASGSDDQHILIWHQNGKLLRRLPTIHSNNIFSVHFVPHSRDHWILSAAGDSHILFHELDQLATSNEQTTHFQKWECGGRVKKLVTCRAEPKLFFSASEDGMLKQYDLRENSAPLEFNFSANYGPLKTLALNQIRPEMLALGISNAMVPIYDRRNMRKEPMLRLLPAHLSLGAEGRLLATSLAFNQRGDELLVNLGSENIYIFDVTSKTDQIDVLGALKSHLSGECDDQFAYMSPGPNANGKTILEKFEANHFGDIKSADDPELVSRTIDGCSEALVACLEENRLPRHIFAIKPTSDGLDSSKNASIDVRVQAALTNNSQFLREHFLGRARCYVERNWEGDQMDAMRDSLSAMRLPYSKGAPVDEGKMAGHLSLVKCLYGLNQYKHARQSYAFYQQWYRGDAAAEQMIKKLEDNKAKEEDSPEWTFETHDYRDYLNRFTGHQNVNTDIKEAEWFGGDDQFIVAGSDCGSIFIWERKTQKVLRVFKGDNYTVNCVQPHPTRCLLASSGIDNVIRYWEPASTALKASTEHNQPEEMEDRNITPTRYELMKKNRRRRSPELVWEQLLNTVGLGVFRVDSTREVGPEDDDDEEREGNDQQVVRCRQM